MTHLVLYESARSALAEARRVDEVKDIRDKAEAIRAYARMAGDTALEQDAAELRLRAERRMGILLAAMPKHKGGRPKTASAPEEVLPPTIKELGIDHKLSARAQRVGGIAERAFEAMVERKRQEIAAGAGRVGFDLSTEEKKQRRANREVSLGMMQCALPDKKFGVILADPEWRFEPYSRDSGMDRAPENHYPTSTLEAICARGVGNVAAADCILFLWATVPMLAEAFCVLDAWGFARFDRDAQTGFLTLDKKTGRYVSSGVWTKYWPGAGIGLGHWFRVDHEILLVATRGHVIAPLQGEQWRSIFDIPASEVHSQKPEAVQDMIDAFWPSLPKIELNARRARPGWTTWGNEAPETCDEATGEIIDVPAVPLHVPAEAPVNV